MGENVTFIEGERIDLLVKNIEHINIYHKWANNPIFRDFIGTEIPITLKRIKITWFPEERDEKNIWFEIWHKKDRLPIGLVGFFQICSIQRRGELGLYIGETEYWGKEIGLEAANLMLDYGFNTLNFHKIVSGVNSTNSRSLRMSKKLGFIEEGRQKDMEFFNGKWSDLVLLGIFKEDREELKINEK